MPTRNLILLIVVLAILTGGIFAFFYFRTPRAETPVGENPNFIATLWPFGKSENSAPGESEGPVDISGYEPSPEAEAPNTNIKKISTMPVAGYGVFAKERYGETEIEIAPYVRYADRATGNIYQTFADNIDERVFSTTIVPTLYEAYFGEGGEKVILRYLGSDEKTIQTFTGTLPKEVLGGDATGENELTGGYLPENISSISISPNFSKIFYLLPAGDGAVGITAMMSGEGKSQVFDSPFTEWLPEWSNERMVSLTTKPSAGVPGYMYAVDPVTKDLTKILGGVAGLTTLTSPSGKLILYADNNLSLKILHQDTRAVTQMGIRTLPEKCVWGLGSDILYCAVPQYVSGTNYPDTWYQGEVSFSDEIWRIDAESGNGTLLANPYETASEEVDAINLKLDDTGKYLFFMNKKDSFLWQLKV